MQANPGATGDHHLAPLCDALVLVDTLSFTTAVSELNAHACAAKLVEGVYVPQVPFPERVEDLAMLARYQGDF